MKYLFKRCGHQELGSMGEQYKMIGNAVPPAFAKVLAQAIAEIYINYYPDKIPEDFGKDRVQCYIHEPRMVQLLLAFERRRRGSDQLDRDVKNDKNIAMQTKLRILAEKNASVKSRYKRRSTNG